MRPLVAKLGAGELDRDLGLIHECSLVLFRNEFPRSPLKNEIAIKDGKFYMYSDIDNVYDWRPLSITEDDLPFTSEDKDNIHVHDNMDVISMFEIIDGELAYNGQIINASQYVHPPTHEASIIVTDSDHQFVDDNQLSQLNTLKNAFPNVLFVDIARKNETYTPDGSMQMPYVSITNAINAIPEPNQSLNQLQQWVILVMPGYYDEHVTIKPGIKLGLYSLGPVIIGNNNTTPSTRSLIWELDGSKEIGQFEPSLSIGSIYSNIFDPSNHNGFTITGNLVISRVNDSTSTKRLFLNNVYVNDLFTGNNTGKMLINMQGCQFNNSITGYEFDFFNIDNCKFIQDVNINRYERMTNSSFYNELSVRNPPLNQNPPVGVYNSYLGGTFSGPPNSLIVDSATFYWIRLNNVIQDNVICIDSRPQTVSGTDPILNQITAHTVSFNQQMPDTTYELSINISNYIDSDPSIYSFIITNKTINGFQVTFSGEIDSPNYILDWIVTNS